MGHAKSRREEQGRLKKNTSERTERAALYGLLTALAMVLGFVESLIPIPFPVPGIRLGLANLVTVAGLYLVGIRGTAAVTVLRIVLTGLSFGNPYRIKTSKSATKKNGSSSRYR